MKKRIEKTGTKGLALVCAVCMLMMVWAGALATDAPFAEVFGGAGRDSVYDALVLSNGNLLLCANTQDGMNGRAQLSGGECRAWLLCLAPDGSVVWEQVFGPEGMACVTCRPLELEDGRIAVQFHTSKNQTMFTVYTKYFSLDGQELSETKHGSDWPNLYSVGNGYFMQSFDSNWNSTGYSFVTPDWEPLWSVAKEQVIDPFKVLPMQEGCLMMGRTRFGQGEDRPAVCLVAKGGQIAWKSEITGYDLGYFYSGKITQDGGVVAAGGVTQTAADGKETRLGLVAKWDSQGRLQWTYTSPFEGGIITGFFDVAESSAGYVVVHGTKTDTQLGFLLINGQGQEIGRAKTDRKGENYRTFDLVEYAGGMWALGPVERNGQDDFLVMKLDIPGMFQ